MGERSQIFVRVQVKASPKSKIITNRMFFAVHHQWSFGERMISRCVSIMRFLDHYKCYANIMCNKEYATKLQRCIDTNWDMQDMVLGCNLLDEAKESYAKGYVNGISKYDIFATDSNHGHIYIDLTAYTNDKYENKARIKYAFCRYFDEPVQDVISFADSDMGNNNSWREEKEPLQHWFMPGEYEAENCLKNPKCALEFAEKIKYTAENMQYIMEHSDLMTEEEKAEFIAWGRRYAIAYAKNEICFFK